MVNDANEVIKNKLVNKNIIKSLVNPQKPLLIKEFFGVGRLVPQIPPGYASVLRI